MLFGSHSQLDALLIEAVIANDDKRVIELLHDGADPNCYMDSARVTPLHFAAQHNAIKTIIPLLQAGADSNIRTSPDEYTPLELAKLFEHKEAALLLS